MGSVTTGTICDHQVTCQESWRGNCATADADAGSSALTMAGEADRAKPSEQVLLAFVADGPLAPLAGGRGLAWRAGSIVLKPADSSESALAWQAEVLAGISDDQLRLSPPWRSISGRFVFGGWMASVFCAGAHEPRRWADIIAAGDRLHAALANVVCPGFVRDRHDPWSIADRAAWGEIPLAPYLDAPHVVRLASRLVPVSAPSQVIHGDLTGNVLFADPRPPAVIDLSVYCRPAGYASAIVVADALAWEAATHAELDRVISADGFGQLLARALLFRIITDWLVDRSSAGVRASAYTSAVDLALEAVERGQ
jgi:uncharacterized protein (TIGR02569 family)